VVARQHQTLNITTPLSTECRRPHPCLRSTWTERYRISTDCRAFGEK
jgi:hypothetical protein